jgi:phosphatidylethanolamine/phosphatidyl-N-methylethanolamine N-methyltransferase
MKVKMKTIEMRVEDVRSAYGSYAHLYDRIFGAVFEAGRLETMALLDLPADRRTDVLEVGVGTGLSLAKYPAAAHVTGVDLSADMLSHARLRTVPATVSLHEMNAQKLEFPDNHFDASVACYVATVAPDPEAVVREMFRVTKPGGRIIFVNHFSIKGSWTEWAENLLQPLSRRLGWQPLFYWNQFEPMLPVKPLEIRKCGWGKYWTLVSLRKPE